MTEDTNSLNNELSFSSLDDFDNKELLRISTSKMATLVDDYPNHFKTRTLGRYMNNYTTRMERDITGRRRRNRVFPYGTLVFVDFGINFGSEFSAPHYAITLTKNDTKMNNTITVIPLTSKEGRSNFQLDESVSKSLALKTAELGLTFSEEVQQVLIDKLGELILTSALTKSELTKELTEKVQEQLKNNQLVMEQSKERLAKYMSDLEKTTYAKIDSITTIDKGKIFKRHNALDPLGVVTIDDEQLKKINKKIIEYLYLDNIDEE
ncbi:type II toxin-antitoxin system PemK/MazF family toxin [Streptococcus sp. NLN64]|uniref:type II toxin-antitoxin system PemK/MazF family toxin n=1 Tax=Streptococcus sp. NLN64 TaxID=2822799 RepID=UPI0018C99BC4|nr:type II toxin-antitoxin system PemK/MazF family toxin [Streptococcus sp. NLN64]MBG9366506.1 type II toxin-antitoxin system PemK/MazF family toxin [Streptococcus sp. NLN64]